MRCFLLAFLASPVIAHAACPTQSDLAEGIGFDIAGGGTETYKALNNGVIEVVYSDSDGFSSRTMLGQGAYLLEVIDLDNGAPDPSTRITYSHVLAPEDMPVPRPNGGWVSKVASMEGGSVTQEVQDHTFGPMGTLTVGACSYDTFEITVRYDDADESIDTIAYLPELGIGLLVGIAYNGSEGERVDDRFSYFDLRTMAPAAPPAASDGRKGKKSE